MKKFLSLVLAVIMTMSLVTISASAAEYKDFTDKDEIQYEEAVAVLNRLGIITGYSEGDFRPEGELTRGAAAKIIASLLIGPEAAENLSPTTAPFKDVPLDHTFAGPIAYCSTLKIINGYSDGSFQPGGTLTGYAFAKMLLGALGYDSSIERFTGPGWNMNVMRLGGETGLFDRLDFKGNDPVNREQAAQLALNTLKGTMVEYTGGINVTTSDGSTMTSPANRIYKTSNQEYATHILNRKATQTGSASSTDTLWTVEFGEEHFVDLRMKTERSVQDDFGRPSNEWSYKKVTIGTYPIEADKTYTEQVAHNVITVSNASKARSLELTGNKVDKDTVITVNGKDYTTTEVKSLIGANLTDVGQIADFTDNGTVVEVYIDVDRADWVSNIVVIKTQLMEVKRLGKESVSLDLYDNGSANKGKTVFGFNQPAIDEKVDNVEIDDDYYSLLSGLKVGDLVAVVPVTTDGGSSYTVAEAYVPETVSGSLKKVNTFGTSSMSTEIKNVVYAGKNESTIGVTVGDTAYNVALWNKDLVDVDGDKLEVTTKDVTLTLDKFGNALLAKDVGATSDFMIVGSYYQNLVNGKLMTYVKGWDISGEELNLNLGSKFKGYSSGIMPGDLAYYTNSTSGDADWTLDDTTARGVFDVHTGKDPAKTSDNYSIKASNSRIMLAQAYKGTHTNSWTTGSSDDYNPWIDKGIKFIYVTFDDDGDVDSISIKNGVQAINWPELTKTWNGKNNADYNAAQVALKLKDGNVTDDSTVKAVIIKNESNDAVASNMLYIVNYAGSAGKTDNGDIVYEYTVAMNGSNGLVDDEMTIYSTKKLSRGDWARYTAEKNDDFENFYKLSPVDQRERATSTMVATFKAAPANKGYPVANNKSLVHVDPNKLYAIDGRQLRSGNSDPYKMPTISESKKDNLGVGDELAGNLISLRYATWVDLTNNGIDSYEDLADLIDDGYSLNNVQVSMIFNDDDTKDNFRQAAMVIVLSVGGSTGSQGGSTGTYNNGEVGGTYEITDRGVLNVHATLTRPDWAADDAVASGTLRIYVGGTEVISARKSIGDVNSGADSSGTPVNGVVRTDVRVTGESVDQSETISWKYDVTWDKVALEINGVPAGTTWKTVDNKIPTSIENKGTSETTFKFELAKDKYYEVDVTVSGGTTTTSTIGGTEYTALNGENDLKIKSSGNQKVVVTLNAKEIPATNSTVVTSLNTEATASSKFTGVTSTNKASIIKDLVTNLCADPGAYQVPVAEYTDTDGTTKVKVTKDTILDCGGTEAGSVFFPFTANTNDTVTLIITDDGTEVYRETVNSGTKGMAYFFVQLVKVEGTTFSNAQSGTGITLNEDTFASGDTVGFQIIGQSSGVIMGGTFQAP